MNAPRLRVVLAAASMSVAWPLVVSAQTRAWDNYCTQGTFQACMSVDVSLLLVPGPPGGFLDSVTAVTVSIRNLQGTLGTNEAWGFQGLLIRNLLPHPVLPFTPITRGITPSFLGTGQDVNVPTNFLSGLWDYGSGSLGSSTAVRKSAMALTRSRAAPHSHLTSPVFSIMSAAISQRAATGGWYTVG